VERSRRGARAILAVIALAATIATSIGFASVFTYYPVTVNISPVAPPVSFTAGSNTGQPDLGGGNTISVTIGQSGASADITIHPTFRTTYYKNITLIKNWESGAGAKAYKVYIKVVSQASLPSGSTAKIYIYSQGATRSLTGFPNPAPASGTYVASVSLLSSGTTSIGTLNAGSAWEVDILVYIPESSTVPSPTTAQIQLIYTPSSETPP